MRLHHIAVLEIRPVLVFIFSRHHVGSASHADGSGVVMMIEYETVCRQPIEIRSLHVRGPVASHRVKTLIVGQEEDDVRLLVLPVRPPSGD